MAYQLPLGRQEDFNLPSLELKSNLASTGKTLYLDSGNLFEPGHKNCNACHFNGGGTAGMSFNSETPGFPDADGSPRGFNVGFTTSVNDIPLALALGLPRDGGFGALLTAFGSFGNTEDFPPPLGRLELEEFNTPPVVESADTGPFFHNHTVKDLESAVAFYGTQPFQTSIPGTFALPVTISADPDDPEVQAIAAFLRVLNALENIRSSLNVAERGRRMARTDDMRELAGLALAETIDAMQVLSGGALARRIEPGHSVSPRQVACGQAGAGSGAASADSAGNRQTARCSRQAPARGAVGSRQSGDSAAFVSQMRRPRSSHTIDTQGLNRPGGRVRSALPQADANELRLIRRKRDDRGAAVPAPPRPTSRTCRLLTLRPCSRAETRPVHRQERRPTSARRLSPVHQRGRRVREIRIESLRPFQVSAVRPGTTSRPAAERPRSTWSASAHRRPLPRCGWPSPSSRR